jgi:lysozyme
MQQVPFSTKSLPPVIDVEFYCDKENNPPPRSLVDKELQTMVNILEDHYGKPVILYTTQEAYILYIKNDYNQCDI